ncbi:hypothetical protein JL720_12576 [Aureococcus anophagefferens]|nr:hypothetical protein JL720_12576 [Aureococcus anophagefferens]
MVQMHEVNRASILHVRARYGSGDIYTAMGSVLTPDEDLEPHIWFTARRAYRALVSHGVGQSLIVSGESGSGKTETTKKALEYVAAASATRGDGGGGGGAVSAKVLSASPILEAFGNAKTLRDNNSSRFGKYLEVVLDGGGRVVGAKTTNYLLEKSRVVRQAPGERGYHAGAEHPGGDAVSAAALGARLGIGSRGAETFAYARRRLRRDRASTTSRARRRAGGGVALNVAEESGGGSTASSRRCSTSATSPSGGGRRHGRVKVVGGTAPFLEVAAALLGVGGAPRRALVTRTISAGGRGSINVVVLAAGAAGDARDALAKALYAKLFDWAVDRVNREMEAPAGEAKTIGVLDIFGFEIFDSGSTDEGVPCDGVEYKDNSDVIALLGDVLAMLDEEARLPRGSAKSWSSKVKPNMEKVRRVFRSPVVLEQLTYAGVFETVTIQQSGWPFRSPHERFATRYFVLDLKNAAALRRAVGPRGRSRGCGRALAARPREIRALRPAVAEAHAVAAASVPPRLPARGLEAALERGDAVLKALEEGERLAGILEALVAKDDAAAHYDDLERALKAVGAVADPTRRGGRLSAAAEAARAQVRGVRDLMVAKRCLERGVAERSKADLEEGLGALARLRAAGAVSADFCAAEERAAEACKDAVFAEVAAVVPPIRNAAGAGACAVPLDRRAVSGAPRSRSRRAARRGAAAAESARWLAIGDALADAREGILERRGYGTMGAVDALERARDRRRRRRCGAQRARALRRAAEDDAAADEIARASPPAPSRASTRSAASTRARCGTTSRRGPVRGGR